MKAVIAVDSVYGNTAKVAEAMKDEIEKTGSQAELINLSQEFRVPTDGDIVLVGSPTRIGKMTRKAKRFVKKLDAGAMAGKTVVTFDTHMMLPEDPKEREKSMKWVEPGAAGRLRELARQRGLKVHPSSLRFKVTDMKGPLAPGELERARESVREILSPP